MSNWFNTDSPHGMCVDCNKVDTSGQEDGEFVCAGCSNHRYSDELCNGQRIELKLRLKNYKPGTLELIQSILKERAI